MAAAQVSVSNKQSVSAPECWRTVSTSFLCSGGRCVTPRAQSRKWIYTSQEAILNMSVNTWMSHGWTEREIPAEPKQIKRRPRKQRGSSDSVVPLFVLVCSDGSRAEFILALETGRGLLLCEAAGRVGLLKTSNVNV